MKKQILTIAILFCVVIANLQAQQWSGLNNTTGNIYRTGNVGIGVANPTQAKLQFASEIGNKICFGSWEPHNYGIGLNNFNLAVYVPFDARFSVRSTSLSGAERFVVKADGNVGVNESNPTLKFQVNGGDGLALGLGESGTGEGFGSRRSEGENRFGLDFYAAFEKRMSITQGGYVGIGTASPERKLHLAGGNLRLDRGFAIEFGRQENPYSYEPTMMWDDPTNSRLIIRPGGGWADIEFSDVGKMEVWGEVLLNSGDLPKLRFGDAGSGEYISCSRSGSTYYNSFGLDFSTAFQKRMSITQGGKVGIGINSPDQMPGNYLLYVAQGIMTEKVKVALRSTGDWADYVFADGYQLRSLEEVEQFVKENKHLPGVPSAEEVHQSGIDVAAMDAKLLEKIEELTLYMIELKKENESLRREVEEIRKERK